jgi:hypothetical protein
VGAPACCENGFKWFLFVFYDLGAVLSSAVSSVFFAVSPLLKPAKVFQFLKSQADDFYVGVSKGQGNFLFDLWRQRVRQDGPSRTVFGFLSFNDHSLAFQLGNVHPQGVV